MRRSLVFACIAAAASVAHAHGRPAALGSIVGSTDRRIMIAQATWGAVRSDDGGASWRSICAAAYGVDARSEDPSVELLDDGSLLVGTFGGLWRSPDGGCTWNKPSSALDDVFAIDLAVLGSTVFVVASGGADPDRIHRSDDDGATFTPWSEAFGDVLIDRLRVAPSDPSRMIATGAVIGAGPVAREAIALRSFDGGRTFDRTRFALEAGERMLHVWAFDPRDAEVAYGQVLHFNGESAPERVVRTADGGASWETVFAAPYLGGIVVMRDGSVIVGSRLGGVWRAADGRRFEALDPTLAVTCLAAIDDELWACVDPRRDGTAIARWDGNGFTPIARLDALGAPIECASCTEAQITCPAWAADIAYDLGLDAALPANFDPDAGTGAPRDAGVPPECRSDVGAAAGCGCRIGSRSPPSVGLLVFAGLAFHRRAASRRRARRPATDRVSRIAQ